MATVTAERERGQLILIGALALAVSLVAIALVLNSAIYTHNLASRYDSPGDDASTFSRDAVIGAGGAIDYANERYADQGYATVLDKYRAGLTDVEKGFAGDVGVNGRIARIQYVRDSSERGVYIADKEPGGSTFRPAALSLNADWTVAKAVRARQYNMRVEASTLNTITDLTNVEDLLTSPTTNTGFVIEFDDGGQLWRVALYDDGGVNLMVWDEATSSFETCSTSREEVTIDITGAKMGGDRCEALAFMKELSGTHTIRYYDGDLVEGTYELTADRTIDDDLSNSNGSFTDVVDDINYGNHCDGPTYYGANSGEYPMVAPVIFQSTIDVTYDGPDVTYSTQKVVAPEMPGNGLVTPRVTKFDVTDNSGSGEFVVDWTVHDPNGDLVTVEITVDGTTKSSSVSGNQDSGSTTMSVSDGNTYDVDIVVIDDGTNSRTVTQRHDADGDDLGCPP